MGDVSALQLTAVEHRPPTLTGDILSVLAAQFCLPGHAHFTPHPCLCALGVCSARLAEHQHLLLDDRSEAVCIAFVCDVVLCFCT